MCRCHPLTLKVEPWFKSRESTCSPSGSYRRPAVCPLRRSGSGSGAACSRRRPAQGGQRRYAEESLTKVGVLRLCQDAGLHARRDQARSRGTRANRAGGHWSRTKMADVEAGLRQLNKARDLLAHALECAHDGHHAVPEVPGGRAAAPQAVPADPATASGPRDTRRVTWRSATNDRNGIVPDTSTSTCPRLTSGPSAPGRCPAPGRSCRGSRAAGRRTQPSSGRGNPSPAWWPRTAAAGRQPTM